MGWKIYDEAIEMGQRQFQYFPRVFRWRGRRYDVDAVEKCWSVSRRRWRRRMGRHYFQLRCAEGVFEVYQEVRTNTWRLRRARLAASRVSAARRAAVAWR
jgi:Domain of unknown function (DUF6504)